MNGVDERASGGETHAAPSRGIAALGAIGGVFSVVAAVLAARGRFGLGAVAAGIAGAGMFVAATSGRAEGRPSRWTEFVVTILGRAPDATVMAGVAWHFRLADRRVSALAVAAVAITFLAAYARTRAIALGWPIRTPSADPLRYGAAFAALAVPGGAEAACWILVVLTFIEFVRVAVDSWRHAEGA